MNLCLQYKWGIFESYKKNCELYCKLCIWHVCLWEPVNPASKDGPEFHMSSLENHGWMPLNQWDTSICNQPVLFGLCPHLLGPKSSLKKLTEAGSVWVTYSNDLTDEISCIFWFTEFRLCLPVWIRQTTYMRIIPRYHIGAFSVQADLVAGGTSCSFLREQHCHFLGQTRYYNSLYDL